MTAHSRFILIIGLVFLGSSSAHAGKYDAELLAYARATLNKILFNQSPRPSPMSIADYDGGGSPSLELGGTPEYRQSMRMNCKADEQQFLEMQDALIFPWKAAWMTFDTKAFAHLTTAQAGIPDLAGSNPEVHRRTGQIVERKWPAAVESLAGKKGIESLSKYLHQFSRIEAIELATIQVKSDHAERDPDMSIRTARLSIRADIRGVDGKSSARREDRGNLLVTVVKDSSAAWKITDIRASDFQSLTSNKPAFTEVTQIALNNQIPTYLRTEAIRRGGYAMAFGDYDGDGNADMYVGAFGPGVLLRGDGHGGFKEVKDSGLGQDTLVKTAIFADFSNSGRQDLLLIRFTPHKDDVDIADANPTKMRSDVVLYRNLGNGKYKRDTTIINRDRTDYAMPAAVADFNHDGYLDFYVGFPGAKDFTTLTDAQGPAIDVQVQGLFMNQGGNSFRMVKQAAFQEDSFEKKTHRQKIFPHSALAVDFNQDGHTDILVMDDRGNLSPAYQNRGDGTFYQVAQNIGVANDAFGMGIAASDFDNDGRLDLMMSNVNFLATRRLNNSCSTNWGLAFLPNFEKSQDLRLFKGMGKGQFSEVTVAAGLEWAGEGLAGVEFIDYNNDGLMDIYVTNGLWTGTSEKQDLSSLFMRERADIIASHGMLSQPRGTVMDILRFFKGDVKTGKVGTARPEMAGHQRNRLFRNDGDGHFTEVGYLEGVDSIADGYMMAKADINNDGIQDIVLRNADPGSAEVKYPPVQVYLNQNPTHAKVLRLAFEGSKSNRDGIGAEVTVTANGRQQLQQVIANNGTVQSERTLSFGLGKLDHADEVKIRWPSGIVQHLTNVPAGKMLVHEPDAPTKLSSAAN